MVIVNHLYVVYWLEISINQYRKLLKVWGTNYVANFPLQKFEFLWRNLGGAMALHFNSLITVTINNLVSRSNSMKKS